MAPMMASVRTASLQSVQCLWRVLKLPASYCNSTVTIPVKVHSIA